jgi:hypothetical protein
MRNQWMGGALALAALAMIGTAGCGTTSTATSTISTAVAARIAPPGGPALTSDRPAAFRDFLRTEADLVTATFGAEGIPCGAADFRGCRVAAVTGRDASQAFLDYLAAVVLPAGLAKAEGQLRQALTLCISGSKLQIKGIDDIDTSALSAGSTEVGKGTKLLSTATAMLTSKP